MRKFCSSCLCYIPIIRIPPKNMGYYWICYDLFMMVSLMRGFGVIYPPASWTLAFATAIRYIQHQCTTQSFGQPFCRVGALSCTCLWELGPYLTGSIPFPSIGQQHTGQGSVTKPSRVEAMYCCTWNPSYHVLISPAARASMGAA